MFVRTSMIVTLTSHNFCGSTQLSVQFNLNREANWDLFIPSTLDSNGRLIRLQITNNQNYSRQIYTITRSTMKSTESATSLSTILSLNPSNKIRLSANEGISQKLMNHNSRQVYQALVIFITNKSNVTTELIHQR